MFENVSNHTYTDIGLLLTKNSIAWLSNWFGQFNENEYNEISVSIHCAILNFVESWDERGRRARNREGSAALGNCWHSLWPQAQIHLSFTRLVTPSSPCHPSAPPRTHFAHNEILINSITKENTLECTTKHQWQQASRIASTANTRNSRRSWGDVLIVPPRIHLSVPLPVSLALIARPTIILKRLRFQVLNLILMCTGNIFLLPRRRFSIVKWLPSEGSQLSPYFSTIQFLKYTYIV